VSSQHEHEFEAARGLPEQLPRDEQMLWQGAPDWRSLARHDFHLRKLALYFAIVLAWRAGTVLADGGNAQQAGIAALWLLPPALLALGMIATMAWLVGRTAMYTITDRRVVMRVGVVLTVTFNLPFSRIDSAALRARADGTGNIVLALQDTDQIAYVHLWPHARPWHLKRTEPMLCAVADAARVAGLLGAALAASAGGRAQVASVAAAPIDDGAQRVPTDGGGRLSQPMPA
jgi:hypothetical protein